MLFRSKISWFHGDNPIYAGKKSGKHSKAIMTRKGQLRIKNIGMKDGGNYTCRGTCHKLDSLVEEKYEIKLFYYISAEKSSGTIEVSVKRKELPTTLDINKINEKRPNRIWLNSEEKFATKGRNHSNKYYCELDNNSREREKRISL